MSKTILELQNINKWFGGLHAVRDLNVEIESEEIFAIIGPNGAGKSTLINIITGHHMVNSGNIRLFDTDITRMKHYKRVKQGLGRTFQISQLFEKMTIEENILTGFYTSMKTNLFHSIFRPLWSQRALHGYKSQVEEILQLLGNGRSSSLLTSEITYGEKRIVEIARALATRPRVLLLDEPAAGLNTAETAELGDIIKKIRSQGITVILVEHDMDLIESVADRAMVMDEGALIAIGKPEDVLSDQRVIEAYLGSGIA